MFDKMALHLLLIYLVITTTTSTTTTETTTETTIGTTTEPGKEAELCSKPQELNFEDLKKFYCKLTLDDKRNILLCPKEKVSPELTEDLLSTLR